MNQPQAGNWFSRNWKWLVPIACIVMLALFGGAIFAVIMFVFRLIHSSQAYQLALVKARQDPALIVALGTPIEDGLLTSGSIRESGDAGAANLEIPLSGPKGEATLRILAVKSEGVWSFSRLEADVASTHQKIDMLKRER